MGNEEQEGVQSKLNVTILSPKEVIFKGKADFLRVPGENGLLGILPGHTKVVSLLRKGELAVKNDESEQKFPVERGIIQVNRESVDIILTGNTDNEDQKN